MGFALPPGLTDALKYTGDQIASVPCVNNPRAPSTRDTNYPLFTFWRNSNKTATPPDFEGDMWYLARFDASVNSNPPDAIWLKLITNSGSGGVVITLSDNADEKVNTDADGNIKLAAGNGITTTSFPLSNQIIIASTAALGVSTDIGGPVVPDESGYLEFQGSTTTYTIGTASNLKTEVKGTNHALFVGKGVNTPVANIAVGVDHSILAGATGADPAFSTTSTPYVNSISFDTGANSLARYINTTAFTPVVYGSTGAGTATYQEQSGRYSVIGNMVFYNINLRWTLHTGTGDMLISGFPFIFAGAQSFYPAVCMMQNIVLPVNTKWVVLDGVNSTTTAEITASLDNASFSPVQIDASGSLHVSGWYPTDP